MLYIYSGDDSTRITRESRAAVDSQVMKGAQLTELRGVQDEETYHDSAYGEALFSGPRVFLVSDVLDTSTGKQALCAVVPGLAASPHLFVIRAGKLDKETTRAFKEAGAKMWDLSLPDKAKQEFNAFALADAVVDRDKKRAWTLLVRAYDEGLAPEEVHGTLFWGIKNMLAVKRAGTHPEESGLSPFVLSKSVRFAKNFSEEELAAMLTRMVMMYHEAHRGLVDLGSELERFVLVALTAETKK